ncbi:hypothetical protein AVEN_258022-1 [Araneus ventricosus]|uniref:Uncharacterized protein n=1 Tax=Araneus ventricosus TaxID=182803 RepID=A0A4Y2NW50_ARAVE|nr:hypothetical protein AVEN_258022-1 [Araneus ventricosus]
MDEKVSCCIGGMITGPVIFFSACLMVKFMDDKSTVYFMFLILTGSGHGVLWASVYELYKLVPRPVFDRYCQRVLGPLLTVYSSVASAYIGYHIGWRFSLAMMTFVPAGIYVTYKGFKKGITDISFLISYR